MRWLAPALFVAAVAQGAETRLLWELGKADNDTREFALAPGGYSKFKRDGFFIVGASDPRRDWPYVHPGPSDAWAGTRAHAFTIVFALKQKPTTGQCKLRFDLVDTQGIAPPRLHIEVNGRPFIHQMPRGAGDASVSGQPQQGREHRFEVAFPASLLKAGNNQVVIRNVAGSWVLYDWLALEAPTGLELAPTAPVTILEAVNLPPVLMRREGKIVRPVELSVRHLGKEVPDGLEVAITPPARGQRFPLRPGTQVCRAYVEEATEKKTIHITVKAQGKELARREVEMKPLRHWTIYLLPHSHVDIGYTKVQTEVERDHWAFFERAIELGRKTRDYPPGARFKWNVEVLWAVESYLRNASPRKRERFIEAVKEGVIGLDALYGNELTALCRPEELVQLAAFARRLARRYGLKIESAMISDVPGYTWGIVPVLAHSGVRYFSIGPNGGARIGYTLAAWADKPFWWLSPSGNEKVLCWIPRRGYWRAFRGEPDLMAYLTHLEASGYPYEMVQMRHCLGDNSGPDARLPDFVRQWNETHASPRLVIATTSEMFREFERRYGEKVPACRGDFTPYWEDGAASSARETALNRAAAERLVQAEALWAMLKPRGFPADDFYQAWRNAILYDEHTWGAHNSVRQPDSPFVKAQWAIKQRFALEADRLSRRLLKAALPPAPRGQKVAAVDVFNTCSWPRTVLVVLDAALPLAGQLVKDEAGRPVPSQRLSTGQLAFLAGDVPPFGARRFTIGPGQPDRTGSAKAAGATVSTSRIRLTLDEKSGAITSLRFNGTELAAGGVNDYFYVAGKDPAKAKSNGQVEIEVKEAGPLVASLLVRCPAPGCRSLTREVRLVDGLECIELINVVDKQEVRSKEGVHFGFAFRIPKPEVRYDIAWAAPRAEADQLPGACKNWFTVQRWADISNDRMGVTWATADAPLVEFGAITAETPWMKTIEPSATLFSYVMNNYWFTNYRASQEGPVTFRYGIKPHSGGFDPAAAERFGIEWSQPLIAVPAAPTSAPPGSLLAIEAEDVVVATLKATEDRKALLLRLFNADGKPQKATIRWHGIKPSALWASDLDGYPTKRLTGPIDLPAWGLRSLRADLPAAER